MQRGEEAQSSAQPITSLGVSRQLPSMMETAEPTIGENDSIIYHERDYEFQLPIARER